jgi:DNA-binding GntR family transcriptional regulator
MLPTSMLAVSSRRRVEADSLNGIAYQAIKEKIIALELPPAALVDEAQLAAELGIGLTPVRQALRRLALENLVVILPRRGTLVADLNFSDLQKIFEIRSELEALAADLAAQRATRDQLLEMENLLMGVEALIAANDNQPLIELDRALHALIARCAHNEFLEQTLDGLYGHVLRLWNLSLHQMNVLSAAMEEHRQILDALKAGNGERAALVMRAHVRHFQEEFRRTFQNGQPILEHQVAAQCEPAALPNVQQLLLRFRDPIRSL